MNCISLNAEIVWSFIYKYSYWAILHHHRPTAEDLPRAPQPERPVLYCSSAPMSDALTCTSRTTYKTPLTHHVMYIFSNPDWWKGVVFPTELFSFHSHQLRPQRSLSPFTIKLNMCFQLAKCNSNSRRNEKLTSFDPKRYTYSYTTQTMSPRIHPI